jgi:tripartite-type tricarboxylate transporter receptor subunit TctC
MNAILKTADVRRRFEDQGVEPVGGTPSQFADHIRAEIQKWAKVVKDANIQPE